MSDPLLRVEGLKVHFPVHRGLWARRVGTARAVDGVSFELASGQTLGLVGESGCGKSTTARAILRLQPITAGRVELGGVDLANVQGRALRQARRNMQMVFQDPYASLNPRMTVFDILAEPLRAHGMARDREALLRKIVPLLERVGLRATHLRRYPHEFSGGQRQRIGIARALTLQPKLIVADEPVSALDVSIRAQIINLLMSLQDELGIALLFIAHDLAVVRHISHEVAVMYLGRIVERAPVEQLFRAPSHPYTQALLAAVPIPDPTRERARQAAVLEGEVPDPRHPPRGCAFQTRCPHGFERCTERPELREGDDGHWLACHLDAPPTFGLGPEGAA